MLTTHSDHEFELITFVSIFVILKIKMNYTRKIQLFLKGRRTTFAK